MNISFPGAKQFLFLSVLFMCAASLHARIKPIFPDEGIWNVTTRIGSTIDNILGATGCQYFIQQADIPLTITASGNYCLIQTVTFTGTAVTINSSNVIFDMRNYAMNGNNSSNSVGIDILAGTNIAIQNGMIKGATTAGISSSQFLNDVIISNVTMIDVGGVSGPSIGFSGGIEGLLIEDCYTSNSGMINITGSGVTIRNCYIDNFLVGAGSGILLNGISNAYESRYSIIEDCILTGSFIFDGSGITVQLTQNVIIQNCIITAGFANNGISIAGATNVQCLNCYIQAGVMTVSDGDLGVPTSSVLVDSCYFPAFGIDSFSSPVTDISVINCFFSNLGNFSACAELATLGSSALIENVVFRSCVFSGNSPGLLLQTGAIISTITVEDCLAQGNGGNGYLGVTTAPGIIQDVVFKDCIAQNCSSSGFHFQGAGCSNIVFEHCISQSNAVDGFTFNATTTLIKVRDCVSQMNGGVGYNNLAAVGANIFLANSSFGDAKAFIGVDLALTKTGATAVSNAIYWNNVVF